MLLMCVQYVHVYAHMCKYMSHLICLEVIHSLRELTVAVCYGTQSLNSDCRLAQQHCHHLSYPAASFFNSLTPVHTDLELTNDSLLASASPALLISAVLSQT